MGTRSARWVRVRSRLRAPQQSPLGGTPRVDWSAIRLGSFFSGVIGVVVLSLCVGPLTAFVSRLSSADYLSLTIFGLVGAIVLSSGSILKALGMAVLGLLLSQVGLDIFSGVPRYTLGITELREDGLNVVAMAIGICGLSRILFVLGQMPDVGEQGPRNTSWLWPAALNQRLRSAWLFRGAAWGALLGMLPGSGGRLASHIAQKSRSSAASNTGDQDRDDAQFVKAASRECANSAAEKTAFISVLVIGMVPSGISALLIVALAIKGASPGPDFINRDPAFFWGFIASMVLSSVFLLALTHPLVALWVRLRRVPRHYVFPALTVFGCIGVYSLNQHAFDVLLSATLAGVGYIFYKLGCELVPLLVGFVSGPILEQHLRQALIYSNGDWGVFVSRPISGGALAASALLITVALFPSINRLREQVFKKFPSP